ncbi:MAG: PDZ domain-containing protein [Chloroflexi bacterium]|nr:PDZ domain-containing protein [Chloroflexota bacterium]
MKNYLQNLIRLLVLMALLTTSAIALAQEEMETAAETQAMPFIGIRYWGVDEGILVTGVIANTPAANADLEAGDVVNAFDETAIDFSSIREVLLTYVVGDTITLSVARDGSAFTTDVTLMALPEDLFSDPDYAMPLDLASVGLYVQQCDDKVFIVAALAGSEVAEAGFHVHDRLISVDGDAIDSIGAADVAVSDLNEGDELAIKVLRGDRELTMKVIVEDHRRRRGPGHRPGPGPRLDVSSVYQTDSIALGYGDDAIEIREISPAHELYAAGLRQYDLITAVNGAAIEEAKDLFTGEDINLTIARMSGNLHFDVPSSIAPLLMFGIDAPQEQDRSVWLGLHEKQVTLGVRYIQLEADSPYFEGSAVSNGAYVAEVIEGLPAGAAGIQVGDIIVAVEGEPATLEIDLRNRIYFHKPGDEVTLDVLRDGELMQVEVTLRVSS